jgi:hypothetical protein
MVLALKLTFPLIFQNGGVTKVTNQIIVYLILQKVASSFSTQKDKISLQAKRKITLRKAFEREFSDLIIFN